LHDAAPLFVKAANLNGAAWAEKVEGKTVAKETEGVGRKGAERREGK